MAFAVDFRRLAENLNIDAEFMVLSSDTRCCSDRQVDPDFEGSQPEVGDPAIDFVVESSRL